MLERLPSRWCGPLASVAVVFAGCSGPSGDADAVSPQLEPSGQAVLASSGVELAALYHFPMAAPVKEESAAGQIGLSSPSAGIVQFVSLGGEVNAWTHPGAPQLGVARPTSDADHERLVREYLATVGVPARELDVVTRSRGFASSAPIADAGATTTTTETVAYVTNFSRRVRGIAVVDSHAGAEVNADAVPVTLSIVWPKVPDAVLSEATDWKARLPATWRPPAALTASLDFQRSEVVIRHSTKGYSSFFWKVVVRSYLMSGSRLTTIDTDESGARVVDFDFTGTPSVKAKR